MLETTHQKMVVAFVIMLLPLLACLGSPSFLEQARTALEEGDTPAAFEAYNQAITEEDAAPDDVYAALTERAELYLQQDDYESALADYDTALTITDEEGKPVGDLIAVYANRAEINVTLENWEAVVADLDTVLASQPDNYEALARRGYAHLQLRNFDEAIADLKGSLQGEVVAASDDLDSRRNLVSAYFDLGQAMLNLGEYEDAAKYHTEALALAEDEDDRAEVLAARGFVYMSMEEGELALADLDEALTVKPDMALAYAYRSYVFSDREQYEDAIADATKAVELGDDLSPSRRSSVVHARALAYLNTNQYELAIADATEAIDMIGANNPDTARTYNIRGQAHRYLGNYDQAITDSSTAIELGSTDVTGLSNFYRNRAYAHYFSNDYPKALADVEAVLSIEADDPFDGDLNLKGLIHDETGEYEAAIEAYQQALTIDPNDPWLYNNLGDVYYDLEDLQAAEAQYREATRLGRNEALFHENLGLVLRLSERYQESIDSYNKALSLDDQRPFSWFGRGVSHYALSQDPEAIVDLEMTLEFDVPQNIVDIVLELLAEIKP